MKDEHNLPSAYKRLKAIKKQIENQEIKKYLIVLLLWHKQEKEEVESKE